MKMKMKMKRRRSGIVKKKKTKKARRHILTVDDKPSLIGLDDIVDIFSFLFSEQRDFLITNNNIGRQVRVDDLRGKTILVYMLSLEEKFEGLMVETFHLIETYEDLFPKGRFEVVFVPAKRGHPDARERFDDLLSKMPWPAVPLSDEQACHRIERALRPGPSTPWAHTWAVINPEGKVSIQSTNFNPFYHSHGGPSRSGIFFNFLGGSEVPLSYPELWRLLDREEEIIEGKIDLNQLLATPCRDFLLTKDGAKVPISSLKGKVVGLYFCDNLPNPRRMEVIKKVYQQALDRGYEFEIVQITFHFRNKCKDSLYVQDVAPEPICGDVPWLTLPFRDSCCRTLRRVFKIHKSDWCQDCLVIINPHERENINGAFFEPRGGDVVEHFGIEAYPFTRDKVIELELPRRRRRLSFERVFAEPGGLILLRHRCGRKQHDQIHVSRLWGKRVLVVFEHHSTCRSSEITAALKTKYLEQPDDENNKFEIVYVSTDPDGSGFERCTRKMPWLVHPHSPELARSLRARVFGENDYLDENDHAVAAFGPDGELVAHNEGSVEYVLGLEEFPFVLARDERLEVLYDAMSKYEISGHFCYDLRDDAFILYDTD